MTRLPRSYGPLRHPATLGLSLAGCRLAFTLDHATGLPVLLGLSSYYACTSPLPRRKGRGLFVHFPHALANFPELWTGWLPGLSFRGLLSVHSRYGLHTCQVTQ